MKKIGIIYKATNNINGKCYIGKTTRSLEKRKLEHIRDKRCSAIHRALIKYGEENFKWEIIYECDDPFILNVMETFKIMVNHSHYTEGGYNLTYGGDGHSRGYKLSNKTKEKISKGNKGKKRSIQSRKKYSECKKKYWDITENKDRQRINFTGENNPMYGKRGYWYGKEIPDDVKQKISKKLSGRILPDDVKQKISKSLKGKVKSIETREKLREANIGNKNPMYGKEPWNKGKKLQPTPDNVKEKLGKKWKINYPDGNIILLSDLKKWCIENNMIYYKMLRYRGYNGFILKEMSQ